MDENQDKNRNPRFPERCSDRIERRICAHKRGKNPEEAPGFPTSDH